jgi:hypothetical protein
MEKQIEFNDAVFNAFVNGPEKFIRYEEHDMDNLIKLSKKLNLSKSDKDLLKHAIKKSETVEEINGLKALPYEYEKISGRYSPKYGLFGLSKFIKDDLYRHDEYKSLDIINRNFLIIYGIAKLNNIDFPAVTEFVKNYRHQCNIHKYYFGNSEESVKKGFANLVYHPVHKENETEFICSLVNDLQNVQKVFKHPVHQNFTFMQIIEVYSTYIIQQAYNYLVENEIIKEEHCVLGNNVIYFKPLKAFNKETIEAYINGHTKICIKLH